jgi:hypothetical protein
VEERPLQGAGARTDTVPPQPRAPHEGSTAASGVGAQPCVPAAPMPAAAPPQLPPWQRQPLPELQALEINAEAMAVAEAVALRIEAQGGFGVFIDYGRDAPYDSSLNAIRDHASMHPLQARNSFAAPQRNPTSQAPATPPAMLRS